MKKLITTAFLGAALLAHQSLNAQNYYTVDLSTGIDNNGNPQGVMTNDPRWTVKTPQSNYRPVKIGTGVAYSPYFSGPGGGYPNELDYSELAPGSAWLTPFPWTAQELSQPQNASPYPWSLFPQAGDMKYTAEAGTYIYKLAFNMQWPTCKRPNWAQIHVYMMAGLNEVKQIYVNGYGPINVANYAQSNVPNASSLKADDVRPSAAYVFNATSPTYPLGYYFPPYNIPVPASYLTNGTNYLYVVVDNPMTQNIGAGFICQAELQYNYGADVVTTPNYTATVSSRYLCAGANPTLNMYMTNLPFYGATVSVTSSPAVPGFPYTGQITQYANFQVPLHNSIPATYTVTLTNNDPLRPCTSVRTVKTYACNVIRIDHNPINWTGRMYTGSSGPEDPSEEGIPGFETKWMLEELDLLTAEPLYRIINPSVWATEAGKRTTFNGFTAENSYSGDVTGVTGAPDNAGVFSADRVYRITRSYRSTANPDWQEHSIVVGPGYDELTPPEDGTVISRGNTGTGLPAATFSVYPNPGKDVFHVSLNGGVLEGDIEVMNALGARVLSVTRVEGEQLYQIDLSNQPKGIYFVKMNNSIHKLVIE